MIAMGSAAWPRARACARPSVSKAVEQTVSAALPCLVTSMLSWTLHDEQEPQSPEPAMTTSHSALSAAIIAGSAGIEAEVLRRFTTRATP